MPICSQLSILQYFIWSICQFFGSAPWETDLRHRTLWHCSKDNSLVTVKFTWIPRPFNFIWTIIPNAVSSTLSNQKNSPLVRFIHLPSDPHCTQSLKIVALTPESHLTLQVSLYFLPVQLYNSTNGTWKGKLNNSIHKC